MNNLIHKEYEEEYKKKHSYFLIEKSTIYEMRN